MTSTLFKRLFVALSAICLVAVACDTDFNTIGSDILEDDIHHNGVQLYTASATAFDQGTGPVQSNNLPIKALGVYNNPVFGTTTAHVVTQLELNSLNPTFYSPTIDSVYLYVPYFSTYEDTQTDGTNTYTLDSISGDQSARMKLSIYRNGYFLRDSDPATASSQQYFNNERPMVEAAIASGRLNDGPSEDNDQFYFKSTEAQRIVTNSAGSQVVKERLAPGMFMYLNKPFFQETILNHPEKLVNNNVFKEYMRGLYFKIEQNGSQAAMAMMRFSDGYIKIIYKENQVDSNGQPVLGTDGQINRISKTLQLNLKTNTINFFDTTQSPAYASALVPPTPMEPTGEQRLWVKGGEGSVAFIDILSQADIDFLRSERVVINEANLVFNVDNSTDGMGQIPSGSRNAYDPLRLYLYDVRNKRPIYDYYFDTSTYTPNSKLDKYILGGIRETKDGETRYKIRLTNHIANIINKDSTNVRLGLAVTESINVISNAALKNPVGSGATAFKFVPVSSVMTQRGTVLYGTNAAVPAQNRLKLEIYYTKPN